MRKRLLVVTATTVALVLLYTRPGRHRRSWWALAALTTAGMAWSRTYLQVHWLTDVVAGSLLGVGLALLIFAATQIVREKSGEAGRRPAMATRRPPNEGPRHIRRTSR